MSFLQSLKRFKNSITSRLNPLPASRSPTESPSFNSPSTNGPPGPPAQASECPVHSSSDTNDPTPIQAGTTNAGGRLAHSPTLILTGTTGEVTLLSQRENPVDSRPAQLQPTSNPAVGGSITPARESRWVGLKAFLRVLDQGAGLFGPLKTVVGELVECIEVYERVANGRDEFNTLESELQCLFKDLQQHFSGDVSPVLTTSMESFCTSILQELSYVKDKKSRGTSRRQLQAIGESDEALASYRSIQRHLQRLTLNANLSMWKIADEQAADARLDRLCPSLPACYNSRQATELKRGACTSLAGTRVDVLGQMYDWVYDRASGSVYWLNGMAGTGKTTIAYSLCDELDAAHNLGASFFCSRLLPECRDVSQIVPSVAYQLAYFSRPFRWALSRVLEKERNVHMQLVHIQFEKLIVRPLVQVRDTLPEDLVVVIDALDECDNKKSTGQILEVLLSKTSDLPIKFFMTSRPEPEIRDQMIKQGGRRDISRLVLHELDEGIVQGDIERYLRAALEPIKLSESQIAALVQRAGILFIYAATVARYIGYDNFGRNPRSRLETVLGISTSTGSRPYQEIDELYTVILKAAIDDPGLSDGERDDMKQVLYTVLCARKPLTISALSGLLDLRDVERVHAALRPLWSVLHVVETSEIVTALHVSFPDYVFDPKRSKDYHCDPEEQDYALARRCFEQIKCTEPQFNICGLESSCLPDEKIANLVERIGEAISPELSYACQFWAIHLEHAKYPSNLTKLLDDFLSARLLLWMEVMNLEKCMDAGVGALRRAEEWCVCHTCSEELRQLTRDAWRFVIGFALSPASQSTPHIYVSMLAFWPESAPVSKHYGKYMRGPKVPQGSAIALRRLELLVMWPVTGNVSETTWSPDNKRLALVAGGQTLVMDALTGQVVIGPLQLTASPVLSIGVSPDGTRIVSGSEDGTIGIWDSRSGRVVLSPIKGHNDSVRSVKFSPDGASIISSSDDQTIHMRDSRNAQMKHGPLKGHTGSVRSVAFSPDGSYIVSGSDDNSIRMWDSRNGRTALGPLHGHTDWVRSVAFSPKGTYIVSGSYDNTLRIWDTRSGQTVLGPLEGHAWSVTSVAYSPDGTRIVSGSYDNTIRMWDAHNGQTILGPLEGHVQPVTSVTFSPDGSRIVSGSDDNTIRVWDARGGQTVPHLSEAQISSVTSVVRSPSRAPAGPSFGTNTAGMWGSREPWLTSPLERHTDLLGSIALAPSRTRTVYGSVDSTICTWNTPNSHSEPRPLENDCDWSVMSAAFSPDCTRAVFGSNDGSIRVLDTQSAQPMLGPLEGHTGPVGSVSFSPDGTLIVSGANDHTLRTWNAQNGQALLGPLSGHNGCIGSVAFSPDSTHIISGSYDNTIRVWDANRGETVLGPLREHTRPVQSVAFSPDGASIISGSSGEAIQMWDVRTGKPMFEPFDKHRGSVRSLAFSPDGTRVISASDDGNVRMWDVRSPKEMLGIFKGHTQPVRSVVFSPDGTRIVSGSDDRTVRMWDAQNGQAMSSPFIGHVSPVISVAFAPNGTYILSSSDNKTICMWDARSKQGMVSPSSPSQTISNSWELKEDGWVTDSDDESKLLIWVPLDIRHVLLPPRALLKVPSESVGLNFINASIGESWVETHLSV